MYIPVNPHIRQFYIVFPSQELLDQDVHLLPFFVNSKAIFVTSFVTNPHYHPWLYNVHESQRRQVYECNYFS